MTADVEDAVEAGGVEGQVTVGDNTRAIGEPAAEHHGAEGGGGAGQADLTEEGAVRAGEAADAIDDGDVAHEVVARAGDAGNVDAGDRFGVDVPKIDVAEAGDPSAVAGEVSAVGRHDLVDFGDKAGAEIDIADDGAGQVDDRNNGGDEADAADLRDAGRGDRADIGVAGGEVVILRLDFALELDVGVVRAATRARIDQPEVRIEDRSRHNRTGEAAHRSDHHTQRAVAFEIDVGNVRVVRRTTQVDIERRVFAQRRHAHFVTIGVDEVDRLLVQSRADAGEKNTTFERFEFARGNGSDGSGCQLLFAATTNAAK